MLPNKIILLTKCYLMILSLFWNLHTALTISLSHGFVPTPLSVTVQSLAATAIRLKCTLQFKPAHQSQASSAVTVTSNICTTKGRLAESSTPLRPLPFPSSDSSSPSIVFGPKISFYPCDPLSPLC